MCASHPEIQKTIRFYLRPWAERRCLQSTSFDKTGDQKKETKMKKRTWLNTTLLVLTTFVAGLLVYPASHLQAFVR
jgi:hypothetical protein